MTLTSWTFPTKISTFYRLARNSHTEKGISLIHLASIVWNSLSPETTQSLYVLKNTTKQNISALHIKHLLRIQEKILLNWILTNQLVVKQLWTWKIGPVLYKWLFINSHPFSYMTSAGPSSLSLRNASPSRTSNDMALRKIIEDKTKLEGELVNMRTQLRSLQKEKDGHDSVVSFHWLDLLGLEFLFLIFYWQREKHK